MNKYFFISVLVSVVISGLFSYFLFTGIIKANINNSPALSQTKNYQSDTQVEILSVRGTIAEIMGDEYVINTSNDGKITIRVSPVTTYATSFSPTQAELEALYGTATSTSDGKPLPQKLKLKIGDRIEAIYSVITAGKTEFVATGIKLIR